MFRPVDLAKVLVVVLVLLIGSGIAVMQQTGEDDDCTAFALEIVHEIIDICADLGRNQACYGHQLIDIELIHDADVTFASPGDRAALAFIRRFSTAPFDAETGEWGVALMKVQATLFDSIPGQNITFLLTGDVTLTNAGDDTAMPMQAFYFTTGVGETRCRNAPDSLVLQSPQGVTVNLTVNGVDITLGSTAVLSTVAGEQMDILLVGGGGIVAALGDSQLVAAGQQTTIALGGDDGMTPVDAPTAPVAYDPARLQGIPFNLLPQTIEVPANTDWVNTGIALQAGQMFTIVASGLANVHARDDELWEFNVWVPPTGLAVDDACVGAETHNMNCRCISTWPERERDCPLSGAPLVLLLGRVGDGEPFAVGNGGTFTAPQPGDLWLTINDDGLFDNAGAFSAIVTALDESGGEILPVCRVNLYGTVNLRGGPGTTYAVVGTLSPGMNTAIDGQAAGNDGFVWWRLESGAWVRADVTGVTGFCAAVPEVPAP